MASRLGITPWDRERLTPAELKELWDGFLWRRSRDMEVVAKGILWLRSLLDGDADYDKIIASLPGYDGEHERRLQEKYGFKPPEIE